MAKLGRPPLNRTPKDEGTVELNRKRREIAPGNNALSISPLDAMFARSIINESAHKAAEHFRSCRLAVFGSPHPISVNLLQTRGDAPKGDREEAEVDYREACKLLRKKSPHHLMAIDNAIVHEVWPSFMWNPGRKRAKATMMEALAILRDWSHEVRKRRAAEARRAQGERHTEPMRAIA